jgi:CRP/FNR family transcriptional regulator, cyclic AMP receptor protein
VTDPRQQSFTAEAFLASAGLGRRIVRLKAREVFFSQGNEADSIFYVVSEIICRRYFVIIYR